MANGGAVITMVTQGNGYTVYRDIRDLNWSTIAGYVGLSRASRDALRLAMCTMDRSRAMGGKVLVDQLEEAHGLLERPQLKSKSLESAEVIHELEPAY